MTNNELFINLYNQLDDMLREYYNINNYSISVINKRINELKNSLNPRNIERAEKLDIIRNLRNSLVHVEKIDNNENFIISKTLNSLLKFEIDDLKKPKQAKDICKPINEVLTCSLEDKITEVAQKMLNNGYTHIPVLVNGFLYGVFSENTIFTRFVKNKNVNISNKTTIKDYSDYITIQNHETQCFMFVAENTKVIDLVDLFSKKINNKRLVMLFVSKNGVENEKVIGIITSHDLLK